MDWILIAGALCLSSHNEICVSVNPFNAEVYVRDGIGNPMAKFDNLEDAIVDAEGLAKVRDEDAKATITSCRTWGAAPLCTMYISPKTNREAVPPPSKTTPGINPTTSTSSIDMPYGLSKEEFGAFIEEHVRKVMEPPRR